MLTKNEIASLQAHVSLGFKESVGFRLNRLLDQLSACHREDMGKIIGSLEMYVDATALREIGHQATPEPEFLIAAISEEVKKTLGDKSGQVILEAAEARVIELMNEFMRSVQRMEPDALKTQAPGNQFPGRER